MLLEKTRILYVRCCGACALVQDVIWTLQPSCSSSESCQAPRRPPVAAHQGAAGLYLVDPKFREQFQIAHPSPRYEALLAAVPAWFVGSEERLIPLVELLCAEMSAAFRATGGGPSANHLRLPEHCRAGHCTTTT